MFVTILLYVTFGLFALGQLGRISFLNQEVNFYTYDIVLTLTLLIFFFKYHFRPLQQTFNKYKIILLFIMSLLFSFILGIPQFSLNQNIISFLYFIRFGSYTLYFLYLHYHLKKNNYRMFSKSIRLFFFITIITSFVQYFFYPDLRNLIYQGWDPHYQRMFGTFFDTSSAAALYGLSFLFVLDLLFKLKKKRTTDYLYTSLFLISLILTFSRSSYIALFISLFYYFLTKKIISYALLVTLLFFLLFILVPKEFGQGVGLNRTFSISSRIFDYQQGIQIWSKNPIFGVGYNRLRYIRKESKLIGQIKVPSHAAASLSSSYLIILICGGIVGLGLFIASIVRLIKANKEIAALIIFIAVLSFFDNIFLHPFVLFLLGSFICSLSLPSDTSRR